jgi:hypothetical protein
MEVVHVGMHSTGTWLLGCTLFTRLKEEELHAVWLDG